MRVEHKAKVLESRVYVHEGVIYAVVKSEDFCEFASFWKWDNGLKRVSINQVPIDLQREIKKVQVPWLHIETIGGLR